MGRFVPRSIAAQLPVGRGTYATTAVCGFATFGRGLYSALVRRTHLNSVSMNNVQEFFEHVPIDNPG